MALRSVLDIEVNSSSFDAMTAKWQQFQAGIAQHNATMGGGAGAGAVAKTGGQDASKRKQEMDYLTQAWDRQAQFAKSVNQAWKQMSENSTRVARNVIDITTRFMRLGALMGAVGGLATGFGFLGMDQLGRTAAGWRRNAAGLGSSIGGNRAFGIDYGRFFDPNAVIGGVGGAMRDPTKRIGLSAIGVNFRDGEDTADVAARTADAARNIAKQSSEENLGSTLTSRGLDKLGFTTEDLLRMRRTSDEEWGQQRGRYGQDKGSLNLPDTMARQWQDFTTQMQRAGATIETTFIKGLTPLAPSLEKLSSAFTDMIDKVLKQADKDGWIQKLSDAVDQFTKYLTSPDFQKDIQSFIAGVKHMGEVLLEWLKKLGLVDRSEKEKVAGGGVYQDPDTKKWFMKSLEGGPNGRMYELQPGDPRIPKDGVAPSSQGSPPAGFPLGTNPLTGPKTSTPDPNPVTTGPPSASQSEFVKAHWDEAVAESKRTGLAPETILAQAGLESGWGKHAPGNNFFGIKYTGIGHHQSLMTKEAGANGQLVDVAQDFAAYNSPAESFQAHSDLMMNDRYKAARDPKLTPEQQIAKIKDAGYATDPNYVAKGDAAIDTVRKLHASQATAAATKPPVVTIRVANETGGNAVASTAQVAANGYF